MVVVAGRNRAHFDLFGAPLEEMKDGERLDLDLTYCDVSWKCIRNHSKLIF